MEIRLPQSLHALLREVVAARRPAWLGLVDTVKSLNLDHERRVALCHLLTEELSANGLTDDSPNERGLLIEALIDRLEPWRENDLQAG